MPIIKLNDLNSFPYKLENLDFDDMVVFEIDHEVRKSIHFPDVKVFFTNCKIKHTIVFKIYFPETEKYSFLTNYEIKFENCFFKNYGNQNKNFINIQENESISLKFINCIIDDFKLSDSKFNELVISKTIIIGGRFIIDNSKIDNIIINNSLGEFIVNDKGQSNINLHYCDDNLFLKKDYIYHYREAIKNYYKSNNIFSIETKIILNDCKIISCEFQKIENKSEVQITDYHNVYSKEKRKIIYYLNEIDIKSLNINLEINQKNNLTKTIFVKNSFFNKFIMRGVADSFVNIEHLHSSFISFEEFNSKEFKFYDITANNPTKSIIQLFNSNFTNTHFNKVNFKSFKTVNFYRCYIEEIKFSSTIFPENIESVKNILNIENKENDYFEMQYEIFRQLKSSSIKNNNQVQALEMHKKMHTSISKFKKTSKQDKFILCLNSISNKHDTSIYHPFRLMFSSLIFLWFLYCFFLPNRPFIIGWDGINEFMRNINNFIIFTFENFKVLVIIANPVHNISNLQDLLPNKNLHLTDMNYVISYFSRIIIAWLSYQFISAFRKFGKKL